MKKLLAVNICAVVSVNILAGCFAASVPDEENANTGTQEFVIAGSYTQEHEHPEYRADDDTFSPL